MELRLHHLLAGVLAASLCCAAVAGTDGLRTDVVKQFPLDERTVYEIPIGRDVPTTLMFPSAISAIEGANVTTNPQTPAPVLLAYEAGQYFLTVRALTPGARGAVNVVWRNRTFVIRFQDSATPYGSVTFYDEDLSSPRSATRAAVTPDTLLRLLDRAKSYRLLEMQYPEAVQQIEHTEPGNVCYYRDFQVTVREVFRFDPEDTLVFSLEFNNRGDREIYYQPQRLAVRVGQDVFYPSIVDASGVLPPHATTSAYLAITGNPRGGRANLSPKNIFSIIVMRVERDAKLIVPQ